MDHERLVSDVAQSVISYQAVDALIRQLQTDICHVTVDQLCQPWVQRLFEIDRDNDARPYDSILIHACHCLRYRQILSSSITQLDNG